MKTETVKRIFIAAPHNPDYFPIFDLIHSTASDIGKKLNIKLEINRANQLEFGSTLTEHIITGIKSADLIIADISGNRPNIMYEIGMAHALNLPIILISTEAPEIPFDLRGYYILFYSLISSTKFRNTLAERILNALENPSQFILSKSQTQVKEEAARPSVFISYSNTDKDFLNRLQVHLRPLVKSSRIDLWDDTRIQAGEKWKSEIKKALDKAVIAILLISADFLASDFIVDNELPPILKFAEEKGTLILPLVLKPCRFLRDKNLSVFQAINDPKEPLIKLSENDREELYALVAERVENEILSK
jgi:hypothetical protein